MTQKTNETHNCFNNLIKESIKGTGNIVDASGIIYKQTDELKSLIVKTCILNSKTHIEIDREEYIFFLNQAISICIAGGLGKTTVATVGSVLLWKSNNTQCRQREVVNFPAICMDLFKRLFPPGRWTQEDLYKLLKIDDIKKNELELGYISIPDGNGGSNALMVDTTDNNERQQIRQFLTNIASTPVTSEIDVTNVILQNLQNPVIRSAVVSLITLSNDDVEVFYTLRRKYAKMCIRFSVYVYQQSGADNMTQNIALQVVT